MNYIDNIFNSISDKHYDRYEDHDIYITLTIYYARIRMYNMFNQRIMNLVLNYESIADKQILLLRLFVLDGIGTHWTNL